MKFLPQPTAKRITLLVALVLPAIVLGLIANAAIAANEVLPPYAGLENPFDWEDQSVQAQGKSLYSKSCAACHGVGGDNYAQFNFANSAFADQLEAGQDYYFWIISEGRMSNGMPPLKSQMSETERWQVLTYLWSMGRTEVVTPSEASVTSGVNPGNLVLTVSERNFSPSALVFTASLKDKEGKPISDRLVKFFLQKSFFVAGSMEVGEATTDNKGQAQLIYSPSERGEIQVTAREGSSESSATWTVTTSSSYQSEAGIRLPTLGSGLAQGSELAIGPTRLNEAPPMNEAPPSGFRLPGGILSWLLLFVGVIILIWSTYFRVFRQILLIPESGRHEGVTVKVVPIGALLFVLVVGAVLTVILLRGPNTHLHLIP